MSIPPSVNMSEHVLWLLYGIGGATAVLHLSIFALDRRQVPSLFVAVFVSTASIGLQAVTDTPVDAVGFFFTIFHALIYVTVLFFVYFQTFPDASPWRAGPRETKLLNLPVFGWSIAGFVASVLGYAHGTAIAVFGFTAMAMTYTVVGVRRGHSGSWIIAVGVWCNGLALLAAFLGPNWSTGGLFQVSGYSVTTGLIFDISIGFKLDTFAGRPSA